jgi:Ca2+-binding RTX toxin-like protein
VTLVKGVLQVVGTSGDDDIAIDSTSSGTVITVTINGDVRAVPRSAVSSYLVKSLQGNDVVSVGRDLGLPGIVKGGGGNDVLNGGAGSDTLAGGSGDDQLDGGPGKNLLQGDSGIDTWAVLGSDQADVIEVNSPKKKAIVTTLGTVQRRDVFSDLNDAEDRLFVDLGAGNDAVDVLGSPAATLYGGAGDDTISGGSRNDLLHGGLGNDLLSGRGGDDYLFGYSGDDVLSGGAANDVIIGSGGRDTLRPGSGNNKLLLEGLANDSSSFPANFAGVLSTGPQIAFQKTVTIGGSLMGFAGSATANVSISGSMAADGAITGSFSASGDGSASGFGCKVKFQFSASGSVSGTLRKLKVTASFTGSGTAICDGEQYSDSLSGSWSGTISLSGGKGSQSVIPSDGNGGFAGSFPVDAFTTYSAKADAIGIGDELRDAGSRSTDLSSVLADILLNDPRIDHENVTGQLESWRRGAAFRNKRPGGTVVDPRVLDTIRHLAEFYDGGPGSIRIGDIANHSPDGDHGDGRAVDISSRSDLGKYFGDTWDLGDSWERAEAVLELIDNKTRAIPYTNYLGIAMDATTDEVLTAAGAKKTRLTPSGRQVWLYKGVEIFDDPGNPNHIHLNVPR